MTSPKLSERTYDKANSLLTIDAQVDSYTDILGNLLQLRDAQIGKLSSSDPLRLALEDLFDASGNLLQDKTKFWLRDHVFEEIRRLGLHEYARYLRYRYAYEIFPTKKIVSHFPPVVQIEPTSICNYRCVFCYQTDPRLSDKKNGHMGSMSIDLFKNVVDQLVGNVEGITLASRGEPTVNRNIGEMLSYLSGKFLAAKINTNASLLNEKLIHDILASDLQTVVFSADAADKALYSKLRVNGNLDRVLKNIRLFNKIREEHYSASRTITRVSGVSFSEEQNFSEIEKFWGGLVDQVAFVQYNPWENVYDADVNSISVSCSDLWRRLFVWWDGKVAPCDVDYLTTLKIGSVKDSGIGELWNSANYNKIREFHLSGKRQALGPCNRCQVI